MVVIGADRQGAIFIRQGSTDLVLQLESALEGHLLAELADKEGVGGALDAVGQAHPLEDLFHVLAGFFTLLQHEVLAAHQDHLAHGEVPHALQRGQVDRFVAEAVAYRRGDQLPVGQGLVGQGEIQVVAHRRRKQGLDAGERVERGVQAVLVTGSLLRELVDHFQVFAQVRDKGQRLREGTEVAGPLQVARRDEGGEAVRDGAKAVGQLQEQAFEIVDQAGHQRAQGKDAGVFLVHLAACHQLGQRVSMVANRPVEMVLQHLDLRLERALGHRNHHVLDLFFQLGLPVGGQGGRLVVHQVDCPQHRRQRHLQPDLVRADTRLDDPFIHVGQLGLDLPGQVIGDRHGRGELQHAHRASIGRCMITHGLAPPGTGKFRAR